MRRTISVGKRANSRWTTKHRSTTKETPRNGPITNFFVCFATFVVTAFRFGIRVWIRGPLGDQMREAFPVVIRAKG